jgi:hypothetical protein
MPSSHEIKQALETVTPGSPQEAMLLGQHRLNRAHEINQPIAEANARAIVETAQRDIDPRGQHAAHIAVEAAAGHASHIDVHHV